MLNRPYVIHPRRPFRCLLIVLLVLALCAFAAWYWGDQWREKQLGKLDALENQYAQMQSDNQRLSEANRSLNEKIHNLTQMQAMRQATDSQLETDLQVLQDKVIELNKELLFYQNITQGNISSQLQVRELHLRATGDDSGTFMYRIVLTQGTRITKAIKGEVLITLNLSDDSEGHSRLLEQHSLKIRHVQVLEGTVKLAENERPDSIRVMLRQGDKTLTERTFKWEVSSSPAS
jgi:cell division protein FtsB